MEKFFINVVLPNSDATVAEVSSAMKTIRDLKERISQEFQIPERFLLVVGDHVLPANENIKILKQSDVVKVVTGIADYYPYTDIRIKLDLSFYYRDLRKFGYVWIPLGIKNFEDFKKHISDMCSIPPPIKLLVNGGNFNSLYVLKDEDLITFDDISVRINPEHRTIRDLMDSISKRYEITEKFTLNINNCVLPIHESIGIIKQSDAITVMTEPAPYFPFTSDARIKLDLSRYCFTLKGCGYIFISSKIKTMEDLKAHISELYFIDDRFTLSSTNRNSELKSLCELKSEDVVLVIPETN